MAWKDTLLDAVDATSRRTAKSGPEGPWVGVLLRIHPDIRRAMHECAKRRGVTMQTWLRRLVVMGIAKELGTGYAVWMDRLPVPIDYGMKGYGLKVHAQKGATKETLEGIEGMCTHPGCDEIHV